MTCCLYLYANVIAMYSSIQAFKYSSIQAFVSGSPHLPSILEILRAQERIRRGTVWRYWKMVNVCTLVVSFGSAVSVSHILLRRPKL